MSSWKRVTLEESWNKNILKFDCPSYLQFLEWGLYKKALGEEIVNYESSDENGVKSQVQCTVHIKLKKIAVVWMPGDLCGDLSQYGQDFIKFLKKDLKVSVVYVRTFSHREKTESNLHQMGLTGWKSSSLKLDSGQTMVLDLNRDLDEIRKNLRKSFRHNLNRFTKRLNNAEVCENPSAKDIREVYESMENFKGLQVQYSEEQLAQILEKHRGHIFIVRSRGKSGESNAIRACLIHGNRAWDFLAASNNEARNNYATFGLFWALIEECHKRGVQTYDLAGIDPINNKGVFNFKKGTGAEIFDYLGEWEKSNSKLFLASFNLMYKLKGIFK